MINFFNAFLGFRFAPPQAIIRARLRRLRASVLGHNQKQVNALGGPSQNLLIFGYFRAIRNAQEGLTSVGKEIPEREMSVAQAVGQVCPPRNELGDHVGVAGREIWFQDQCPVAEISNMPAS